jgi:hypothetical protein
VRNLKSMTLRFAAVLFLSAFPLVPACTCSGNGHLEQGHFYAQPGDDVVNCMCNLSFDNEHCTGGTCAEHFAVELCLPPSLQLATQGADPVIRTNDGGVADTYSQAVDRFCRDTATHVVYHMIKVFNGGWCMYKAPFAPDGGIGDSVQCFAMELKNGTGRATTTDDGTCRTQCQPVPCEYATNCGSDVQDVTGMVHPENCKCSIITDYGCPGDPPSDLPTPLFCRPPPQ